MRYWRMAAVVCLALLGGACGDEESPTDFGETGNLHGTWVLEQDGRATYYRITSDAIRVYQQGATCFTRSDYTIQAIDGPMFTLVSDTESGDWQMNVDGETLVIDNGVETVTLVATDVRVETLNLCAAVVLFDNLHPACEALPEAGPGVHTGVLEPGDAEWDGTWYDIYALRVAARGTYTISLTSTDGDLDMYLAVFPSSGGSGSGDAIVRNDDIDYDGGNYDSRLTVELDPGCYVILVNSYDGDDAGEDGGNYTLEVLGDVAPPPPPEPDFDAAPCAELPQLTLDSSVMGMLEDADAHWSDGSYFDVYGLEIDATTEVTIEQRAGADDVIDSYLLLYEDDAATRIDEDDDSAGDFDSQIVATLDPGCYMVVAGSYSETPDDAGTYMVSVSTGTTDPTVPHEPCVNLPLLGLNATVNGTFADPDPLWDGTWVDLYSIQLIEPTNVRITLQEDGSGVDTYLALEDFQLNERIATNDDIDYDGGNYNSQVEATLTPGCYVVLANNYDGPGDPGGAYTLNLTTF